MTYESGIIFLSKGIEYKKLLEAASASAIDYSIQSAFCGSLGQFPPPRWRNEKVVKMVRSLQYRVIFGPTWQKFCINVGAHFVLLCQTHGCEFHHDFHSFGVPMMLVERNRHFPRRRWHFNAYGQP